MKTALPALLLAAVMAAPSAVAQFPAMRGAPGAAAPQIAPQDLPYTNNIAENPGFEKGLASDPEKGWVERIKNNAEAKCAFVPPNAGFKAFEGKKALHLKIKSPVKFQPKFLNDPNWGAFVASANNGKGASLAGVSQKFPVVPGRLYALRLRWRSEGLHKTNVDPGPDRGISQFEIDGTWLPAKGKKMEASGQFKAKPFTTDASEWTTFAMPDLVAAAAQAAKTKKMPNVAFIRPPKDAAFLMLNLKLNCCAPNVKPEVWIDQFELAEIDLDELKAALLPSLPAAAAQAAAAAGAAKAR